MAWSKGYSIDYGAAGDTVKGGVQKIDDEITTIYTKLNLLDKAHYGTSSPTSPDTGDMWLDSNTSPPTLKYWTGAAWSATSDPSAYTGGHALDEAVAEYSKNAFIVENGDYIELVGTAAKPVTIEIRGELRQEVTTIQYDKSAATAGTYDVFVKQDVAGDGFTLSAGASPYSLNADERKIGQMKLSGIGTIQWIESDEVEEIVKNSRMVGFHVRDEASSQTLTTTMTKVAVATTVHDDDGLVASSVFTAPYSGFYLLNGSVALDTPSVNLYVGLRLRDTTNNANLAGSYIDMFRANAGINISSVIYLASGTTVEMQAATSTGTCDVASSTDYRTRFEGIFLGSRIGKVVSP